MRNDFRLTWLGAAALLAVGLSAVAQEPGIADAISGDEVSIAKNPKKGIVLLAVRWDRRWNCAGFENAQLRVIGFDKLPSAKAGDDAKADIHLGDAPLLATKPAFDTYAFRVEPGEYGLVHLEIKVARSVSDVRFFRAPRSKLLNGGRSEGGTFSVGAGEAVYIGHFYLDCHQQPTMWRYYPDGREAFNGFLGSLKSSYPALEADKVVFRLFQTRHFGNDYKLP